VPENKPAALKALSHYQISTLANWPYQSFAQQLFFKSMLWSNFSASLNKIEAVFLYELSACSLSE
jgi:hypothetical protein